MLTDAAIRRIKPGPKPKKTSDGLGLYLLSQPSGSRLWRLNYRFAGLQKTLALGLYPDVGLSEARERRDQARRILRQGADPGMIVKAEKQAVITASTSTFAAVSREWFQKKMIDEGKAGTTIRRARGLLETLNASIGNQPLTDIEAPALLAVLRRSEAAGHHENVSRLRSIASQVFRYGIATGRCSRDVAADLRGATTSATITPRPAIIHPAEIGQLMRAIDSFHRPLLRLSLQLLALTFPRPGELLSAQWSEIEGDVWNIPAERTKMRRPHRIPLSRQALAVLNQLREITGNKKHLFASPRKKGQPFAANKLNIALREMNFAADQMVAHGFRAMASTVLNESGQWSPDVIERQLAHVERNSIRRAYNRAAHWPERVAMMQWWADHLDELRGRGEIVALPKKQRR